MKKKKPSRPVPYPIPGTPRKAPKPLDIHRAIQTAKDALTGQDASGIISLPVLALSLGIDKSKVLLLIEKGYLKVIEGETVALPPPAALEWLKEMFTPLPLRPIVTMEMVVSMTGMDAQNVRRICACYGIPLKLDDVFGELMTIEGLYTLWNKMCEYNDPTRFDRQAFISIFQIDGRLRTEPLEFSDKLEIEIKRINKLPLPRRDFAAAALWDAYQHAKTIRECAKRYGVISAQDGLSAQSFDRICLHERLSNALKKLSLPDRNQESG